MIRLLSFYKSMGSATEVTDKSQSFTAVTQALPPNGLIPIQPFYHLQDQLIGDALQYRITEAIRPEVIIRVRVPILLHPTSESAEMSDRLQNASRKLKEAFMTGRGEIANGSALAVTVQTGAGRASNRWF